MPTVLAMLLPSPGDDDFPGTTLTPLGSEEVVPGVRRLEGLVRSAGGGGDIQVLDSGSVGRVGRSTVVGGSTGTSISATGAGAMAPS